MTLAMVCEIIFAANDRRGEIRLNRVNEVRIESSWKEFTGLAEITLPRAVRDYNRIRDRQIFKSGDAVTIKLGYNTRNPIEEFSGYISEVAEGIPYRLKCQDEMYRLKRGTISVSQRDITLKTLLQKIAPGYAVECPDVKLGTVRYSHVTPITVLDNLKKQLGLYTYFEGKTLHAVDGNSENGNTVNIFLEQNAVSENLNNKKTEDEKIKVKFKSLQKNGRYLIVEKGDDGGTTQERSWPYLTKEEVEVRVERILKQSKDKGVEGTITLFGIPRVTHGMKANISSLFYTDKKGTYYIDKVVKTFGTGGYRQELTLGNKVIN